MWRTSFYKYCKSIHWRSMEQRGCLRVGTLYDYRRADKFGELVTDSMEGTKVLSGSVSVTPETEGDFPSLKGILKHTGAPGARAANITMQGVKIRDFSDCMIFSAALEYSVAAHQRWFEAEGYDACYRIFVPRLFSQAITEGLGAGFRLFDGAPITYADELDIATMAAAVPPMYVKRHTGAYLDQAEFRAVWKPLIPTPLLEPTTFNETRAKHYVELHAMLGRDGE